MFRRLLPYSIAVACVSLAWPSVAAEGQVTTGLTNTGIGMFIIAIAFALLLTLVFRATASRIGRSITARVGEYRIQRKLRECGLQVQNQFIIPGAYGGLTRVNHAVLLAGGIVCIQTKHYNGIVSGGEDEPQWTNVDGVHRRKFLNPLIQNAGRTRALQKIVPDAPVASLVVFTGSVQFRSPLNDNVIHLRDLPAWIAKQAFPPSDVDDWNAAWSSICDAVLTDEASRKDFNAQLSFS